MNIRMATAALVLVMTSFASGVPDPVNQECSHTLGNSCYIIIKKPMSWYDANAECNKTGSHLVWVESKREHRVLVKLAHKEIHHSVWIGFDDLSLEGNWTWSDRTREIPFVKWAAGEPNNHGNNEDCAAMWKKENFKWFDTDCARKLPSICEKNLQ